MPSPTLHSSRWARFSWPVATLCAWTLVMWGTRARNIFADDDRSAASTVFAFTSTTGFVLAALVVAALWMKGSTSAVPVSRWFAGVSAAYWLIRVATIVAGDHDRTFTVVHAALGALTVLLAVWVLRSSASRPASRATVARTPA